MGNGFGKSTSTPGEQPLTTHQERVYGEMFRAIEQLGRKLEKSEGERERLTRRLALIESAATVDEKTGRLYLPAVIGAGAAQSTSLSTPRWAVGLSLGSAAIALFALGFTFFQASAPALTPQQLAALDAMVNARVATLDEKAWQEVPKTEPLAEVSDAYQVDGAETPVTAADEDPAPDMMAAAESLSQIEPTAGDATADVADGAADTMLDKVATEIDSAKENSLTATETAEVVPEAPAADVQEKKAEVAEAEKPVEKTPPRARAVSKAAKIEADLSLSEEMRGLERRAFDGLAEAQHDLATIYASGKMIPKDYKRAAYWFSRAADGGVANAHYNLGVMFQQGLGVQKDIRKAVAWYQSAANLGHPEAMYNLGIAYVEGVGVARDIERGAAYFRRAANGGVAQAAYNLGILYETNFLGAVDLAKADEWYRVAANEGHRDAAAALSRVQKQRAVAEAEGKSLSGIEPAAGGNQ